MPDSNAANEGHSAFAHAKCGQTNRFEWRDMTMFLLFVALGVLILATPSRATPARSPAAMSAPAMSMARETPRHIAADAIVGPVRGRALLRALRRGGLILWMRHGARDERSGLVSDAQAAAHDCAKQSRLTAKGEAQARAVGAGMRALKLPIAAVYAARLCRTEATARLLDVGPVKVDARLDEASTWRDRGGDAAYETAVLDLLSMPPPAGQNVAMVSSKLTVHHPHPAVLAELGTAEVAVFRPRPGNMPQLLARIGPRAWTKLVQLTQTHLD